MRTKTQVPRNARSDSKIRQLRRDNVDTVGYWFLVDVDTVTIAKQNDGERVAWKERIPRSTFEKFIDWYNTGVCKGGQQP